MKISKYQLYMHGIVLVWGFTGILGKLITLESFPLVWWRMIIAVVGIGIYMLFRNKSFWDSQKNILYFFLTGLCIAAHWIFFFESIKISTVSVALATLSSAVFFTAIIEPLFFKRKVQAYEVGLGVAVMIGLALIFGFETEYITGIVYALISAFLAATFTVINGQLIKTSKAMTITFYEMLGGLAGISIYLFFSGASLSQMATPSLPDLGYLLILGLICTAFAFAVSVEVMKELSPYTVSMSVNMEPIYAILMALFFFGEEEQMSWGFYLGTIIIVGTILLNAYLKKRAKKKITLMAAEPSIGLGG